MEAVRHRFCPTTYEDVKGDLSKLAQIGSVADFQAQFEDLMNKVTSISEPLLISFFITGLKQNLHRELQFHRPPTLMETFAMARAYEARLDDNPPTLKNWIRSPHKTSSLNTSNSQPNTTHSNLVQTLNPKPPHITTTSLKPSNLPPLLPTPNSTTPVRNLLLPNSVSVTLRVCVLNVMRSGIHLIVAIVVYFCYWGMMMSHHLNLSTPHKTFLVTSLVSMLCLVKFKVVPCVFWVQQPYQFSYSHR